MYLLLFSTDRNRWFHMFLFCFVSVVFRFFFSVHSCEREGILSCMLFGVFLIDKDILPRSFLACLHLCSSLFWLSLCVYQGICASYFNTSCLLHWPSPSFYRKLWSLNSHKCIFTDYLFKIFPHLQQNPKLCHFIYLTVKVILRQGFCKWIKTIIFHSWRAWTGGL